MPRLSRGREKGSDDRAGSTQGPRPRSGRGLEGHRDQSSYKTTELIVYVLAVLGVLIAALFVDGGADGFNTADAWRYVTYLTVVYMVSRGLAKSGSRNPRDD